MSDDVEYGINWGVGGFDHLLEYNVRNDLKFENTLLSIIVWSLKTNRDLSYSSVCMLLLST